MTPHARVAHATVPQTIMAQLKASIHSNCISGSRLSLNVIVLQLLSYMPADSLLPLRMKRTAMLGQRHPKECRVNSGPRAGLQLQSDASATSQRGLLCVAGNRAGRRRHASQCIIHALSSVAAENADQLPTFAPQAASHPRTDGFSATAVVPSFPA